MIFCSCDADNAGSRVGRAVMSNDPNKVIEIASIIEAGEDLIEKWVIKSGGKLISKGGDEARFILPDGKGSTLDDLRAKYYDKTKFTLSVGFGSSMVEGETGLIYAKLTGKNKTVEYSKEVQEHVDELKSENEKDEKDKQKEAYFKKSLDNVELRANAGEESYVSDLGYKLEQGAKFLAEWAKQHGGEVISIIGGRAYLKVKNTVLPEVDNLRNQYKDITNLTSSVGVGKTLSESNKAKELAKLKGKNRTEVYTDATPKELELRLKDKDTSEAAKMREAMRPGMDVEKPVPVGQEPQESRPEASQEQASQEALVPKQEEQPQQQNTQYSDEFLKAVQNSNSAPEEQDQPAALFNNPLYDQDIEDADYSYSEDPSFSKSLRYAAKYGDK